MSMRVVFVLIASLAIGLLTHNFHVTVLASSQLTALNDPSLPSKTIPRLSNGKPDFNGIWARPYVPDMTQARPGHEGPSELPYTQWGLENWTNYDPRDGDYTANCMPFGLSRSISGPFPMRIMQNETHLSFLYEIGYWFHVVPLDGRGLPDYQEPAWYGHSLGRWEDDTLIIETTGFNGYTRLDTRGHPHSNELHLVQTFDLLANGNIHFTVTVDDPKTYTKPWTNERIFTPFKGELMEYVCQENNRSLWEGRIKPFSPPWRDPEN